MVSIGTITCQICTGLGRLWDPGNGKYRICEKCDGNGRVKITKVRKLLHGQTTHTDS